MNHTTPSSILSLQKSAKPESYCIQIQHNTSILDLFLFTSYKIWDKPECFRNFKYWWQSLAQHCNPTVQSPQLPYVLVTLDHVAQQKVMWSSSCPVWNGETITPISGCSNTSTITAGCHIWTLFENSRNRKISSLNVTFVTLTKNPPMSIIKPMNTKAKGPEWISKGRFRSKQL